MLKKIGYITLCLCMTFSMFFAPVRAAHTSSITVSATTKEPTISAAPMQGGNKPTGGLCKPCQRPFKRLVKAMHDLKKINEMTDDEFKKAFDTLVKIPKEKLAGSTDPDQTAAELLYKDKILSEAQFKKICEALKNMPIPNQPSHKS